jgi:hypothetical protein
MLRIIKLVVASIAVGLPALARAQQTHDHSDTTGMAGMEMGTAAGDWKMAAMARHMAYSSPRPLTAADSAHAAQVISELRQAIARYQDVKVAEADGYKMFAPQIKNQPQYHFTKGWNAFRNQWGFDAARPTSLLYKKDAAGQFHLIGAMYTASRRTSEDELNDRIPKPRQATVVRDQEWTTRVWAARSGDEGGVQRSGRQVHSPGLRLDGPRQRLCRQRSEVDLARRPHGPRSRDAGRGQKAGLGCALRPSPGR